MTASETPTRVEGATPSDEREAMRTLVKHARYVATYVDLPEDERLRLSVASDIVAALAEGREDPEPRPPAPEHRGHGDGLATFVGHVPGCPACEAQVATVQGKAAGEFFDAVTGGASAVPPPDAAASVERVADVEARPTYRATLSAVPVSCRWRVLRSPDPRWFGPKAQPGWEVNGYYGYGPEEPVEFQPPVGLVPASAVPVDAEGHPGVVDALARLEAEGLHNPEPVDRLRSKATGGAAQVVVSTADLRALIDVVPPAVPVDRPGQPDDLVEWLRAAADDASEAPDQQAHLNDAADEIEHLRQVERRLTRHKAQLRAEVERRGQQPCPFCGEPLADHPGGVYCPLPSRGRPGQRVTMDERNCVVIDGPEVAVRDTHHSAGGVDLVYPQDMRFSEALAVLRATLDGRPQVLPEGMTAEAPLRVLIEEWRAEAPSTEHWGPEGNDAVTDCADRLEALLGDHPAPEPGPGKGVTVPAALFADVVDTLNRVGCHFWACEGTEAEPQHMVTCHRCWLLIDLRSAGLIKAKPTGEHGPPTPYPVFVPAAEVPAPSGLSEVPEPEPPAGWRCEDCGAPWVRTAASLTPRPEDECMACGGGLNGTSWLPPSEPESAAALTLGGVIRRHLDAERRRAAPSEPERATEGER